MYKDLFIDVETFSSVDLGDCGMHKYVESKDFQILIIGYAFDDEPVITIDLSRGDKMPEEFTDALYNPDIRKNAFNAAFERNCFRRIGMDIPIYDWFCTMVMSAYCGLPLKLDTVSRILNIKDKKLATGKALIKYFSCPCKPTKVNGMRTRNYASDDPEKWEMYKEYNVYDVLSEREIHRRLEKYYTITPFERSLYILDQTINDRGILIDKTLAKGAVLADQGYTERLLEESRRLSGLDNPNSVAQLKTFVQNELNRAKDINDPNIVLGSLDKEQVKELLKKPEVKANSRLNTVLSNRLGLGKSSIKKYYTMLNAACEDGRGRGFFQFYGANRTGRWAGRLLQLQNLAKNHLPDLEYFRSLIRSGDWETLELFYGDVADILSQLVRTGLVAPEGMVFSIADFSAIEARVISWLANEEWRLEVFKGDGRIYEATGARIFGVPIELVTKGSEYRAKAKIAELALGYEGALGAMKRMGGEKMGLSDAEMMGVVHKWRKANPRVVALWRELESAAHDSVKYNRKNIVTCRNIEFDCDGEYMTIKLPSGRRLFYKGPRIAPKGTRESLFYWGMSMETHQWGEVETYGGKLTENIVQAIARDLIGYSMLQLEEHNYPITMHVHDEAIAEVPKDGNEDKYLENMIILMRRSPEWARDLPLNADGFITPFYRKDD